MLWATLMLGGVFSNSLLAAEGKVKPLLVLRWRQEGLDTLSNDAALDLDYGFGNFRLRFGLDATWRRAHIHALGQAAAAGSLPSRGSFGIGRVYFQASGGGETSPRHAGLAELSLGLDLGKNVSVTAGRIGLREGLETTSGDPRFDWVKRTRLAERLVGTWDWVNVGRRFDGVSLRWDTQSWNLSGFAARVLQGGVDYAHAFEHLDGVDVTGLVLTSKRDRWIPSSELRLFNVVYKDARPSTKARLEERLLVDTLGASLVSVYPRGPGTIDLMLWVAHQFGDYGATHQSATGLIIEGGYGWPQVAGSPWLRGGLARADGDRDPADERHTTFFNLVPTNHKFYGSQDLNAFQNLTNLYAQFQFRPGGRWVCNLDLHLFRLTEGADAWYGGSGPANNVAFGYVERRRSDAARLDKDIGSELDLKVSLKAHRRLGLQFGASTFHGGRTPRALFRTRHNFTWVYVQASWSPF